MNDPNDPTPQEPAGHCETETLIEFACGALEGSAADKISAHTRSCDLCREVVESYQRFAGALADPTAWSGEGIPDVDPGVSTELIGAIARRMRQEEEEARQLLPVLTSGPLSWWRTRFLQEPRSRTAGVVREIIARLETYRPLPAEALELATIAVDVANALNLGDYPADIVMIIRADAARELAFALYYLGRYPEALGALGTAEEHVRKTTIPEFAMARATLLRAYIYSLMDRLPEARDLARRAALTFREFGDETRFGSARMAEARIHFRTGAYLEALNIYEDLIGNTAMDAPHTQAMLRANIGGCHGRLGNWDLAQQYASDAITRYEILGMRAEIVRTRWGLAHTLVTRGDFTGALTALRETSREFEALQMRYNAALVELEVVEVLLVIGETEQVPAICRGLLERFNQSGMTSRGAIALAYLREAVALGQATPTLVRHVHDFLQSLPMTESPFAHPNLFN
jgi:tetratricopeptide (TPR) repeat protein